jgi:hypothetical protein
MRSLFAQHKSLVFHAARFFLDEYRAVFPVNVTSPSTVGSQIGFLEESVQESDA